MVNIDNVIRDCPDLTSCVVKFRRSRGEYVSSLCQIYGHYLHIGACFEGELSKALILRVIPL